MDTTVWLLAILSYLLNFVKSVPPEACFANFRWEDCGLPPQAVLYYYKPGSRCEVGFWRGCQPNPNMFKDEYECVNTCIYTVRAHPEDYHNQNIDIQPLDNNELPIVYNNSTEMETTTTDDTTGSGEEVTESGSGDDGSGEGSGDTGGGVDSGGDKNATSVEEGKDKNATNTEEGGDEEADKTKNGESNDAANPSGT